MPARTALRAEPIGSRYCLALEQAPVKSAHGMDGDIDSGRCELKLGHPIVEPALDVLGSELIGRALMEFSQVVNETDLSADRQA